MAQKPIGPGTRGNADFFDGAYPGGVIARYARATNKGTFTTTETGIVRIDDVAMLAGRAYSIRYPRIRASSSVAADRIKWHCRINSAGLAVVGSTLIARSEGIAGDSMHLEVIRYPAVDENLSIWLGCLRVAGTGNITALGADEGGLEVLVEDLGVSVGFNGTDL